MLMILFIIFIVFEMPEHEQEQEHYEDTVVLAINFLFLCQKILDDFPIIHQTSNIIHLPLPRRGGLPRYDTI